MLRILPGDDYEDDFELLRYQLRRLNGELEINWALSLELESRLRRRDGEWRRVQSRMVGVKDESFR